MLRKILFGVAALMLSTSLASAGEGINVETRLDIGLFTSAVTSVDDDFIDYGGISLRPVVKGSYQFTEEWGAELQFSYLMGFDDDDGEFFEEDADETSFSALAIGGLASYTFKVDDKLSIVPVAGFSWRSEDMEGDADDFDGDGEYEADYFVLDFGCRVKYAVNDQWGVSGELMLGVPLFGDSEVEVDVDVPGVLVLDDEDEGDLDGGFLFSIGATVEFKVQDNIILTGGLTYERSTMDWDYDDFDETGDTTIGIFTLRLGAVFKF
jgi:hypothetical protein